MWGCNSNRAILNRCESVRFDLLHRDSEHLSVDVSEIFYFFVGWGKGKEESEAPGGGGGGSVLLKIPGGGGGFPGEGPRGREGVCSELGNLFGGGGAKYFFSGPKCPPRSKNTGSKFSPPAAIQYGECSEVPIFKEDRESLHRGSAAWRLKVPVHNCRRLPTIVVILR